MYLTISTQKCTQTFIFFIFLTTSTHFLHSLFFTHFTFNFTYFSLKKSPHLPLRFTSSHGSFKILQVADMHYGQGEVTSCRDVEESEFKYCSDVNTTQFVKRLIDVEKPDLLVFTGDNIFGPSAPDAAESLFRAFKPAMESRLPWAAILGNHDQESTMNRGELMSLLSLMDYSVSQVNPLVEDPSGSGKRILLDRIDGFGNYDLSVYGAYGSPLANVSLLSLFFLDSGDRATVEGKRTYGWIRESQLHWLRGLFQDEQGEHWEQNQLHDSFASKRAPLALGFFHIPIPEVVHLYDQNIVGQFQERVACSSVNAGVLKELVSMKNVKAVFMGHDHKNDFCGNLDGIWFCYGGGSGYHAYGKVGWPRRARVIQAELSKGGNTYMGLERISTWKRLDDEILSKIDEQLLWLDS